MKSVDEFSKAADNQFPRLDYVVDFGLDYYPSYYIDAADSDQPIEKTRKGGTIISDVFVEGDPTRYKAITYTNILYSFIGRYNKRKIECPFTIEEYCKESNIQKLVSELELDKEKFWYFVLFAYDFSKGSSYDGVTIKRTNSKDEFRKIVEFVDKHKTDLTITLKAGDKELNITNKVIAYQMAKSLKWEELIKNEEWGYSGIVHGAIEIKPETFRLVIFAKILISFFNIQPQIKRKKGANISRNELKLITLLIHYTGISQSNFVTLDPIDGLIPNIDNLKGYLRQYAHYEAQINPYYGELEGIYIEVPKKYYE